MSVDIRPLRLEETVEVSRVGHRLAMGVQCIDALAQLPATGPVAVDLEGIGSRMVQQRFDLHPGSRHAVRWAARLASLLRLAAQEKAASPPATPEADQTNFALRCFAQRDLRQAAYHSGNDPRSYVPRRLSLTPVQSGGVPTSSTGNIRTAFLWPGAAYPLAGNSTAIRGHIRRGATLDSAGDVPWARVIVTRPAAPPASANFATEARIGWGHGDDRGEFLVVLGAQAVPGGAALPSSLVLRVWVFLPPAGSLDANDLLASLPLEQAGSDPINDVLRGLVPPPSYVRQTQVDVTLRPGEVFVMNDAVLLFP